MNAVCKLIFTHKDITCPAGYEVIDNRNSPLDHRLYSELAGMYSAVERFKKMAEEKAADKTGKTNPDFPPIWVQTNHYRRTVDPDCCNRTYVAEPIMFNASLAEQYAHCHFIEDLQLMGKAIKECYPNIVQVSEQVINGNIFVPYNMVNCQYNQFLDWTQFLFTVLKKVAEYMGNPNYEQIKEIVSKREQPKGDGRNNDIEYQCRIYSFLSERLSTIYWLTAAKKMPVFPAAIIKADEVF